MRNIRYKLVPLTALEPKAQVQLDQEYRSYFEALISRGKDYDKAQELAWQRCGCEVEFQGDVAVMMRRVPMEAAPVQKKRKVSAVRPGVIKRSN